MYSGAPVCHALRSKQFILWVIWVDRPDEEEKSREKKREMKTRIGVHTPQL
jgi:hypothetical protein